MAITSTGTELTFNDATTQTTSGVTVVNVGTGISSTGGKTPTLTNTGVTSLTGAGTVSLSGSTGAITITGTGGSGTVTSVATGNGLQGGTITSTGTLAVACPAFNTVGSYVMCGEQSNFGGNLTSGGTRSAGAGSGQVSSAFLPGVDTTEGRLTSITTNNNLSGTWRIMSATGGYSQAGVVFLCCRVS